METYLWQPPSPDPNTIPPCGEQVKGKGVMETYLWQPSDNFYDCTSSTAARWACPMFCNMYCLYIIDGLATVLLPVHVLHVTVLTALSFPKPLPSLTNKLSGQLPA